jgi:hypothetical protein
VTDSEPTQLDEEAPPARKRGRVLVFGAALAVLFIGAFLAVNFFSGGDDRAAREAAAKPAAPALAPPGTAPEPASAPTNSDTSESADAAARKTARARPRPTPAPAPAAAAPETGALQVESDVSGASVFVDRVYVGTTPATAKDLTPGSHRLNVSADGYDGIAQNVEISPGDNSVTVRFKDVVLNESVAVQHKHSFGSCEGRLVAKLHGVTYETTHKQDAFQIAFSDLERFDIDYLKNNLLVKRKGGKPFNFSDAEGKTDRLLVFHRNVEKARDKLKG